MKVTLLGTSCMVPTKQRNVSGMYLEHNGFGILFDCGEGTQRQMNIAGINRNKVKLICISHWHADHVAGMLGLLQTVGSKERDVTVTIIGPKETKKRLKMLLDATICDTPVNLDIREITEDGLAYSHEEFDITCKQLEHVTPCIGFSYVQRDRLRIDTKKVEELGLSQGPELGKLTKGESITYNGKKIKPEDATFAVRGKKVTYIADTRYCDACVDLAFEADLLVAESTYAKEHQENARKFKHMTSTDAATIAKNAEVKKLVLTHLSQRYKKGDQVLIEAKEVFENTLLGEDFLTIKV